MCASSCGRAAAFFAASGAALSQQVADGKINVQSSPISLHSDHSVFPYSA
jgi:hypothetical protein